MKYHIKNKISKREIRKHGKELIPLMKIDLSKAVLSESKKSKSRRGDVPKNPYDSEII